MTESPLPTDARAPMMAARFARILPLAFITYSLAYLDRVNIGFAASGIRDTLHFSESQFTWFNASFFVGYVLFQIPGAGYAARQSVKTSMFWSLVVWGIIASLTSVLHSYRLLLLDRFLLGAVEGMVFPSLLVFLTHWFTKGERSRANAILILGNPITMWWASLASGKLVDWFDVHRHFGMAGWQLMLLAEGAPTLIWAMLWWFLADDRPADARWMTQEAAGTAQDMLDAEQAQVKQVKDYLAAFCDPQVILLCVLFFAWSVGIYGLNMWLPIILKSGSNLGMTGIGAMNSLPYLCGAVAMFVIAMISDRLLVRKPFVWPCLFIGAAAFLFSYFAGPNHFWIAFIGLIIAGACMYAPYGPFWAMMPEMVSRNVLGESVALINTIGAAGGFVGTYGVGALHKITGGYGASFACLSASLAIAGVLTLAVRVKNREIRGFPVIVNSR